MAGKKEYEIKWIFVISITIFIIFLAVPIIRLLFESLVVGDFVGLTNYLKVLKGKEFITAFYNSIIVSLASSTISTILGFVLAYTINYTNLSLKYKKLIRILAVFPMLIPTITYGFAIIYSFGKQGLLTKLFGIQFFEIYGFAGLLFGYIIYTLPISFLLIFNTMIYIDKKFWVVSKIMKANPIKTFFQTILRPLLGTLAASFIQGFFLSFTDYGIPSSVGGKYSVVSTILYNEMLGSIPNFKQGAVVAIFMLIPSVISVILLRYLERYNIRYNKISAIELPKNKLHDFLFAISSLVILLIMVSVFLVIIIAPFISDWPYKIEFTLKHLKAVLSDNSLIKVYKNSIFVAFCSAFFGLLITYGSALVTARSKINSNFKLCIESIALVTNTIPGMVIGIAYMLIFSGTFLQNTFFLIIICNILHFFSTPYLMMKSSLEKLNISWDTTALLMGDNWIKTIVRIITPNMKSTILEVFGYYFINSMVTVSAVIFIAGTGTMVLTTKIKELQYYTKFNEVFLISLLILCTNLIAKCVLGYFIKKEKREKEKEK